MRITTQRARNRRFVSSLINKQHDIGERCWHGGNHVVAPHTAGWLHIDGTTYSAAASCGVVAGCCILSSVHKTIITSCTGSEWVIDMPNLLLDGTVTFPWQLVEFVVRSTNQLTNINRTKKHPRNTNEKRTKNEKRLLWVPIYRFPDNDRMCHKHNNMC